MNLIEKLVGVLLIGLALGFVTAIVNVSLGLVMIFGFGIAVGILALVVSSVYLMSGRDGPDEP